MATRRKRAPSDPETKPPSSPPRPAATAVSPWERDGMPTGYVAQPQLVITSEESGSRGRRTHRTLREHVVVGSDESADVSIDDPAVSRFHCEIVHREGRILVRDLRSTNGTFVNGVSVVEAYLRDDLPIGIGGARLRVTTGEEVPVAVHPEPRFHDLVGASMSMRKTFGTLAAAARTDYTVLVVGETGTGKESAAAAVHLESERRDKPFIVVDCSALPAELLESELFGHERGAFTGAHASRGGAFLAADGGTIFLDEIGELPLDLQPKLLRALERREIKPVGSSLYQRVDVRIVAATNVNLRAEVAAKRFRSDLFFRLAVIEVELPPLRDRREDLPLLAEHLITMGGGDPRTLLTPSLVASLSSHQWPGNVRELRNYLQRCLAFGKVAPLEQQNPHSNTQRTGVGGYREARDACLAAFERDYLTSLLAENQGNVTAAARSAGLDRIYLYRLLWRHGLR